MLDLSVAVLTAVPRPRWEAHSALPDAPVVSDGTPASPSTARPRRALAAALHRAADRIAPGAAADCPA